MISVELNIFGLETNYGDFEAISYFDNEKKAQEHFKETLKEKLNLDAHIVAFKEKIVI